jgi:hypothetical protein
MKSISEKNKVSKREHFFKMFLLVSAGLILILFSIVFYQAQTATVRLDPYIQEPSSSKIIYKNMHVFKREEK